MHTVSTPTMLVPKGSYKFVLPRDPTRYDICMDSSAHDGAFRKGIHSQSSQVTPVAKLCTIECFAQHDKNSPVLALLSGLLEVTATSDDEKVRLRGNMPSLLSRDPSA